MTKITSAFITVMLGFITLLNAQPSADPATAWRLADSLFDAGQYQASLHELSVVLENPPVNPSGENRVLWGKIYVIAGLDHRYLKQADTSLYFYKEALRLREGPPFDSAGVASVYNNLSQLYLDIKTLTLTDALIASETAVGLYRNAASTSKRGRISSLNNYAIVLRELGRLEEAINANKEALDLCLADKNIKGKLLSQTYYGLGQGYVFSLADALAREAFDKALPEAESNVDSADIQMGLGILYTRSENYDSAHYYFGIAEKVYQARGDSARLAHLYRNVVDLSLLENNFSQARAYLDRVSGSEAAGANPSFSMWTVVDKAETNYWLSWGMKGLIILLIGMALYIWWQKKTVQKKNEELKVSNQIITRQNDELQEKNATIIEQNLKVEKQRSIIHANIKGKFNIIKARLEERKEFNDIYQLVCKAINRLNGDEEPQTLERFIKGCFDDIKLYFDPEKVEEIEEIYGFEYNIIKPNIAINIAQIILLAFTNIRLHAQCTNASLSFETDGDTLKIVIHDDGVGFDPNNIRENTEGIADIRKYAGEIGTLNINSDPVKGGTTIKITVPDPFVNNL